MKPKIHTTYKRNRRIIIYKGNCIQLLKTIPKGSLDLTLTSPPYCMGKPYDSSRKIDYFNELHEKLIPLIITATRPGGSICWQVGYHVNDGSITPLDYVVHEIFSKFNNIKLRNRIIWTFGHGYHCRNRFSGRHEVILWYTKGNDYLFNLDAVRVPQKYPGKKHYKGKNRGKLSGNPLGKNPSDIWDIPNINSNHVEKTEHPCQYPVALARKIIRALSPSKGLVFDPFTGSGTTGVASILENRSFIGAELEQKYHTIAKKRIRETINGKLKYRSEDKPIYIPSNGMSVAKKPKNFI